MATGGGGVVREEGEREREGEEMEMETQTGKSMKRRELHQSPPDEIHLQRLRREKVVAMTTDANKSIAEFSYLRRQRKLSQVQSTIDIDSESVTGTGIFPAPEFNFITGQIMILCRKMEQIEGEAEGRSSESGKPMELHKFDYVSSNTVQKMEENTEKGVKRKIDLKGKSALEPEAQMIYSAFSSTKEDLDELFSHLEELKSFYRKNKQVTNASKSKSTADQIEQVQDKVTKFQSEVLQMLILELEAELGLSCELLVEAKEAKEKMAKQEMHGGQSATGERQWGLIGDTLSLGRIDVNYETQPAMGINGKTVEEQHMNGGKTVKETMAQTESIDDQIAASHRSDWEISWCRRYGGFEDMRRIPSHAVVARTLQIYSIKVSQFKLPVEVYGVVAARDTVDHNRNILFRRERANCQILTEKDPFLRLTGPSRAIVSVDPVTFEILLKVKGRTKSEDQVMITDIFHYNGIYSGRLCSHVISKPLGKITLKFEQLEKTVQATILGICVVEGGWSWPFKHGGRVVSSSSPQEVMKIDNGTIFVTEPPDRQVVLLDYRGQKMPMGSNGYLDLPRQVVSVELGGSLKFLVQTYSESHEIAKEDLESHEIAKEDSKSHEIAKEGSVYFTPEKCNLSRGICDLGDFKVEITIAWSLLIGCKDSIFLQGYLP